MSSYVTQTRFRQFVGRVNDLARTMAMQFNVLKSQDNEWLGRQAFEGGVFHRLFITYMAGTNFNYLGQTAQNNLNELGGRASVYLDDSEAEAAFIPIGGIYKKSDGTLAWRQV